MKGPEMQSLREGILKEEKMYYVVQAIRAKDNKVLIVWDRQ